MTEDEVTKIATNIYNTLGTQFGVPKVPTHIHNGIDATSLPLESIVNYFIGVSTTPTWTPTTFSRSFALDTTAGIIYYYDTTNKAWKSTPTTAFIRSLISATPPILYNNSTGVISFAGASQIIESYTAAESIGVGNAVAIGPYQSDGGITLDTNGGAATTASGGAKTISFTVGNNSNRLLFIYFISANNVSVTATYNGISMTSAFTPQSVDGATYIWGFYLVAPATGTHNLVLSGLNASEAFGYTIYSYYNVVQSSSIAQAVIKTQASASSVSQTVTPLNTGSLLLTMVDARIATGPFTQVNLSTNAIELLGVAANDSLEAGDTGKLANLTPLTISSSRGTGAPNWNMVTVEIAPITSVTYRVSKANTTTSGWNTNWKSNAFIGFSQSNYVLGDSASIALNGTDQHQSGLLPSSQYYVGSSGAIAVTGSRKVGIATSTSEILVTNIW